MSNSALPANGPDRPSGGGDSAEKDRFARFCETAHKAAREAVDTPEHERGFIVAALANHLRECDTCAEARDA